MFFDILNCYCFETNTFILTIVRARDVPQFNNIEFHLLWRTFCVGIVERLLLYSWCGLSVTVVDRMVLAGIYTHGRVLRDSPCPGGATACARVSGQTREGVRAQGGHRVVRFPLR